MSHNTQGAVTLLVLALCLAAPGLTSATFLFGLPLFQRRVDTCVKPYNSCPTYRYDDNTFSTGSCRLGLDLLFFHHSRFGYKSAGTGCAPDVTNMEPLPSSRWRSEGYISLPCVGFQIGAKRCKYCIRSEHCTKDGYNLKKMRVCYDEPDVPVTPRPVPETPKPVPETPQPEPETPQPEPETPQPEPETPQPEPETPQPEPETPQPEPETPKPMPKPSRASASKYKVNNQECFHKIKYGGFCGIGRSCKCCSCLGLRGAYTDLAGPCTKFGGIRLSIRI